MWKKAIYGNYFLVAIFVNLAVVLSLIIFRGFLPPQVPLFYGRPAGNAQLTTTLGLFIAPIASFLIIIINFLICLSIKDGFLKKILAISSIVISILMAITITKIALLVGFF
ncbi:MAG TPA: hypothetical protein VMR19_04885 [Candidatus Saccharimonadales bacterium]|nr:hypothetical protein [Candidatus Saccharimonadales bacterium]